MSLKTKTKRITNTAHFWIDQSNDCDAERAEPEATQIEWRESESLERNNPSYRKAYSREQSEFDFETDIEDGEGLKQDRRTEGTGIWPALRSFATYLRLWWSYLIIVKWNQIKWNQQYGTPIEGWNGSSVPSVPPQMSSICSCPTDSNDIKWAFKVGSWWRFVSTLPLLSSQFSTTNYEVLWSLDGIYSPRSVSVDQCSTLGDLIPQHHTAQLAFLAYLPSSVHATLQ